MPTEKNKVTYILGAGASAKNNQLPTVAKYSEALDNCADFLRNAECAQENKQFIVKISKDMESISKLGAGENTVDAYANWCYINNRHDELYKIKKTLAFFFTIEQYVRGKYDPRYRQFITTILTHNPYDKQFDFPKNIKIINWNYDFQVQLACNRNGKKELFEFNSSDSKSIGKHHPCIVHYYPTMANDPAIKREFNMVHLNGIADYHFSSYYNKILHWGMNGRLEGARSGFTILDELINAIGMDWDTKPLFNFVFEKNETGLAMDDRLKIAEDMIENTDVVVIGYSFAITNDPVDRLLFKSINRGKRLKTIYLQTKDELATDLHARFELSDKVDVVPIRSLDSFHVATEFIYDRKVPGRPRYSFASAEGIKTI